MKRLLVLVGVVCSGLSACVPLAPAWPYSTMASHTVRLAPDRDSDVLWVQNVDGKLYRCAQKGEAPVCQATTKE
jgi:hypothetical protein